MLFDQSSNNPDESFIGIEVFETGIANTYSKIIKSNLKNLKLIHGDVAQILSKNKSKKIFDLIIILFQTLGQNRNIKKEDCLKVISL